MSPPQIITTTSWYHVFDAWPVLVAVIVLLASCNKQEKSSPEKPTAQKTFTSPADAGAAFFEAAKSGDQNALLRSSAQKLRTCCFREILSRIRMHCRTSLLPTAR